VLKSQKLKEKFGLQKHKRHAPLNLLARLCNKSCSSTEPSGTGQYTPETAMGRRLLAHVVQQSVENTSIPANRILRYPEVKIETGVKICYVPLAVFPEWLPSWASPVDHAFIEFDDGWFAGFTMLEGESKEGCTC
jgi:hypothetical protein